MTSVICILGHHSRKHWPRCLDSLDGVLCTSERKCSFFSVNCEWNRLLFTLCPCERLFISKSQGFAFIAHRPTHNTWSIWGISVRPLTSIWNTWSPLTCMFGQVWTYFLRERPGIELYLTLACRNSYSNVGKIYFQGNKVLTLYSTIEVMWRHMRLT